MNIEILVGEGESEEVIDRDQLLACARFALDRLRLHPECELAISFVPEDESEHLHEDWMGLAGPTDVMSFPMDELRPAPPGQEPLAGVLGDIVLCLPVITKQAETAGHSTAHELNLLLIHGILHLIGHDHAEEAEKTVMFDLQDELLAEFTAEYAAGQGRPA